jgi:hypothetical protein
VDRFSNKIPDGIRRRATQVLTTVLLLATGSMLATASPQTCIALRQSKQSVSGMELEITRI